VGEGSEGEGRSLEAIDQLCLEGAAVIAGWAVLEVWVVMEAWAVREVWAVRGAWAVMVLGTAVMVQAEVEDKLAAGGAFKLDRSPPELWQEQITEEVSMVELIMADIMEDMEEEVVDMVEDMEEEVVDMVEDVEDKEGIVEDMAADMVEVITENGTKHQRPKSSLCEGVLGRWMIFLLAC